MANAWMVRAGSGGNIIDHFDNGHVTIGWKELGDIALLSTREDIVEAHRKAYPDAKPGKCSLAAGMIDKFAKKMAIGDRVITYDPQSREYRVGKISSDYKHDPLAENAIANSRDVVWEGRVPRDQLSSSTKNSLGAIMTLFALNDSVVSDFNRALKGEKPVEKEDPESESLDALREATVNRSKELIKDRLIALDPEEMEHMLAALLRAMGFRTRVSPIGPDRGVDVFASPDGLGLEEPRIKAEVKHRGGQMGSQAIRSFIGALRPSDRGIYLSTGGFSKEAKYEADRSNTPVTLMDIDLFADIIINAYDDFDLEGRALLPLVRIYWPVD